MTDQLLNKGPRAAESQPAMKRIRSFIGRHRVAAGTVAVSGLALIVFVLVWFQPQKLFLDQRVDERLPRAGRSAGAPQGAPGTSGNQPRGSKHEVLAEGAFRSLEHSTTGKALVVELATGGRILRFENLNTSNGPDLHVYLSEIPPSNDWHAYGVRFLDLGKLKGNLGSQNYALPAGIDVTKFRSAVVWCKRFAVGFGVAGLPALSSVG
jgi:electron transfer DM13